MPMLTPQAILEGRNSNRTPVPVIVGLIASGVGVAMMFAYYFATNEVSSVTQSTLVALPTTVALVGLVLLVDRLEPEPRVNLALAFFWGTGVAVVGSFLLNTSGGIALTLTLGDDAGDVLAAAVVAPIVEESFKGALLLVILFWRRHEIDGPTDGVVYASLCALGFALVENVLYYMRGWEQGGGLASDDFWGVVVLRGVISPLGHPLYTAMTGLGVAFAARSSSPLRWLAVVGGWMLAVGLHGMWNGMASVAGIAGVGIAYLVELIVLIVIVIILIVDRKRIVGLIRTHLPAYIPSGLVSSNDVWMLGSITQRRRARGWARHQAGTTGARAMGDYQLAATELALLHDHATNQAIPPDKFHFRRSAILALMRTARNAFFKRAPEPPAPPWARRDQSGFFQLPQRIDSGRLPVYGPRPFPPGQFRPPPPPRGASVPAASPPAGMPGPARQVPPPQPPPAVHPPAPGPAPQPGHQQGQHPQHPWQRGH